MSCLYHLKLNKKMIRGGKITKKALRVGEENAIKAAVAALEHLVEGIL